MTITSELIKIDKFQKTTSGAAVKTQIACVIIDEHPVYRIGIRYLLEKERHVAITADTSTVHELLHKNPQIPPDLALLNISIEGYNSLESIKLLKDHYPQIRILVISIYDEKLMAKRIVRAGAQGYLMKQAMEHEVKTAINTILDGKIYFSEDLRNYLLESLFNYDLNKEEQRIGSLSDREFEVFILLGKGFSMNQIANKLNRTLSTIETYKRNIKHLLDYKKTSRLKEFAVRWVKKYKIYQ